MDTRIYRIINNTGRPASDLHVTYAGTGGNLTTAVLVNPRPCGQPQIPSNGQVTNTMVLDWGRNCVAAGGSVTVKVTTINGPLDPQGGFWTDIQNRKPPGIGRVDPKRDIKEISEEDFVREQVRDKVDKAYEGQSLRQIASAPVSALQGVSEPDAQLLEEAFHVKTVRDFADLKFVKFAQDIIGLEQILYGCHRNGIVRGTATPGSYLSQIFPCDDKSRKLQAIEDLLSQCNSTVTADQLCGGECEGDETCKPTTLQSDVNDDAELEIHGPDALGNCYYQLTITEKGNVGWSAVPGTCECM